MRQTHSSPFRLQRPPETTYWNGCAKPCAAKIYTGTAKNQSAFSRTWRRRPGECPADNISVPNWSEIG
ncbi:hypothetical protein DVDV_2190 [Desulfovibrio sp. DV]|nr:hypothetical protein DVDV_2190 [Desulfovibrio sp. DV]